MTLTNIGKTLATFRQGSHFALIIFLVKPPRLAESASARAWPSKKAAPFQFRVQSSPASSAFPILLGGQTQLSDTSHLKLRRQAQEAGETIIRVIEVFVGRAQYGDRSINRSTKSNPGGNDRRKARIAARSAMLL
jgi:hypothetical protein